MMLYDVLKASKGLYVDDSFAMLWGKQLGGWKTITGVLPLTFTAKGGTAVDWVIYGNDENGTENLFDKATATAGYRIAGDGAPYYDPRCKLSDYIEVSASTAYVINTYISYDDALAQYDANKTFIERAVSGSGNFTTSATTKYVRISMINDNVNTKMLVKGSTAPDHYIPYQQGVGERTENLFDKSTAILGKEIQSTNIVDNPNWAITPLIPVEPQSYYSTLSFGVARLEYMSENDNNPTRTAASPQNPTMSTTHFIRLNLAISNLTTATLVSGSTPPETYIPYGYQIPLTVSQQGQPDKTVDIYIGDSPLTEGETVSKTSTGVDIELFDGENTVSTTLYNKPTMEIKYKQRRQNNERTND